MNVLKNSQIRLETLNHALITSPEGKEWRISHWAVDIETLNNIEKYEDRLKYFIKK